MLLKIFKNSFKSTYKPVVILLCIAPLAAIILGVMLKVFILNAFMSQTTNLLVIGAVTATTTTLVLGIFGTLIASVVIVFVRAGKEMASDEAYLTFTLPVRGRDHVLGRVLSILTFSFMTFLSFVISATIIVLFNVEFFTLFYNEMEYIFISQYQSAGVIWDILYCVEEGLYGIIEYVLLILIVLLCGLFFYNSRKRSKALIVVGGIVIYNFITSITSVVSANILSEIFNTTSMTTKSIQLIKLVSILILGCITFVMYKITEKFIDRSINLS